MMSNQSGLLAQVLLTGAALLDRIGVRPDALTYASLVPAIASGIAAACGAFYWAVGFLLLSAICDLFDGPLARLTGRTTRFGALLDSTIDRLSDAAPLIGLVVIFSGHGWLAAVPAFALLGGYTVSYVRARAEGLGLHLPPLWMRRPERMILTGLALLVANAGMPGVTVTAPWTLVIVAAIGILSFAASAHAVWAAAKLLRAATPGGPQAPQ
jgi:CDP-diacylglycerol--glycerol-3-phosphate 3-phosphatidyltransferase